MFWDQRTIIFQCSGFYSRFPEWATFDFLPWRSKQPKHGRQHLCILSPDVSIVYILGSLGFWGTLTMDRSTWSSRPRVFLLWALGESEP